MGVSCHGVANGVRRGSSKLTLGRMHLHARNSRGTSMKCHWIRSRVFKRSSFGDDLPQSTALPCSLLANSSARKSRIPLASTATARSAITEAEHPCGKERRFSGGKSKVIATTKLKIQTQRRRDNHFWSKKEHFCLAILLVLSTDFRGRSNE